MNSFLVFAGDTTRQVRCSLLSERGSSNAGENGGGGRQPFFSLVTGFVGLLDLMMGGIKEMCTDLGVRLGVVTT